MSTLLTILHIITCLFLMLTVLLQQGKGGGMGGAFGGSNAGTVFGGSGASSFLVRLTAIASTVFMMTSMVLAFLASHNSADELEKFGKQQDALSKEKEQAKDEALKAGSGSGSAVGSAMMGSAGSAMLGSGTTPDLPGSAGSATPILEAPGSAGSATPAKGSAAPAMPAGNGGTNGSAAKAAAMGATTGSAAKAAPRASGIQPADPERHPPRTGSGAPDGTLANPPTAPVGSAAH